MSKFNYLSLPKSVQFRRGDRIEYVYDAAGVKRQTKHKIANRDLNYPYWSLSEPASSDFSQTTTTDYIGNKIYVNSQLKYILTEEGYIEKTGNNTYAAYYYVNDHLGNHRIVMDASGNVKQVNNYYPSGTLMAERRTDQGVQPYKFGGKEMDRTFGLDSYDFEARAYDPVLMRFTRPDPLAEKYYSTSPYAYCANNPVSRIDPTGMWIESAWDVFSLVTGVKSFVDNVKAGNVGAAIVDGVGIVADAAAVVLPLVPGGAGAAVKGVRAGEKMMEAVSAGNKVENAASTGKTASKYEDVTKSSRGKESVKNIETDVSKKDFGKNLEEAGYSKTNAGKNNENR